MAPKAYLLKQMAEEKLEKPKATRVVTTIMRMLHYYKEKNQKIMIN
jgi:hypothetical protein